MHCRHSLPQLSYLSCVEELIANLETLNARYRRSPRARKFTGTLDALQQAIISHSPYNKPRSAAFGRLAMELQREWIPFGSEALSIVERQDLRLMLLLFIAHRLDGLESKSVETLQFQRLSQCVSGMCRS